MVEVEEVVVVDREMEEVRGVDREMEEARAVRWRNGGSEVVEVE